MVLAVFCQTAVSDVARNSYCEKQWISYACFPMALLARIWLLWRIFISDNQCKMIYYYCLYIVVYGVCQVSGFFFFNVKYYSRNFLKFLFKKYWIFASFQILPFDRNLRYNCWWKTRKKSRTLWWLRLWIAYFEKRELQILPKDGEKHITKIPTFRNVLQHVITGD